MKARVPGQPVLRFGVLMGGVVIADQVKLPRLLVVTTTLDGPDCAYIDCIENGKSLVISLQWFLNRLIRLATCIPLNHWQSINKQDIADAIAVSSAGKHCFAEVHADDLSG